MSDVRIATEERVGSRDQARRMLDGLPDAINGSTLIIDFTGVQAATQSFIDELIRVAIVSHGAERLVLANVSKRVQFFADRSASRRGVLHRLVVEHH